MKSNRTATRIIAGVLSAMAIFATPALAQDTINTTTAPPPAPASAAPADPTPAPAAAAPASGTSADDQARYQASLAAATGKTAGADASAPIERTRNAPRTAIRNAPARVQAAPAAAAPISAAPAPVAEPSPAPVAAAAPPVAAPAAPIEPATTTQTKAAQATSTPIWMWLVAGLAGLGVILLGVVALRRRQPRNEWVAEEPAYVEAEPTALAAEPVAYDAPVVELADVVRADGDDVAAITDAAAPVAGRPWIELSLRPVRAGATDEAALVDLELTLANAGEVAAKNVRVSTFMLGDASDAPTDMERLLAQGSGGAEVDAGKIDAGKGSRIDARLAIPREGMDGATFQPLVGIDVRYTLPNGSEGRTAAAFTVGVDDDTDTPTPLRLGGDMREDVAATLHGVPERV